MTNIYKRLIFGQMKTILFALLLISLNLKANTPAPSLGHVDKNLLPKEFDFSNFYVSPVKVGTGIDILVNLDLAISPQKRDVQIETGSPCIMSIMVKNFLGEEVRFAEVALSVIPLSGEYEYLQDKKKLKIKNGMKAVIQLQGIFRGSKTLSYFDDIFLSLDYLTVTDMRGNRLILHIPDSFKRSKYFNLKDPSLR